MSQSEGGITPPPGGDDNQGHIQPEKSVHVSVPEAESQEAHASSLSASLAFQYLEEVKTLPNRSLHTSTFASLRAPLTWTNYAFIVIQFYSCTLLCIYTASSKMYTYLLLLLCLSLMLKNSVLMLLCRIFTAYNSPLSNFKILKNVQLSYFANFSATHLLANT